jgi:hypothetical protein
MTDQIEAGEHIAIDRRKRRRTTTAAIGAALLALGGAAGAVMVAETRPSVTMAPAAPVPIRSLTSGSIITVRGQVAETYGNMFVLADGSGRALIDTGREGDGRQLVSAGQPVMVQGRFERGIVHAAFLVGADRKVIALGPLADHPHGPHGPHGPDRGPDAPPPPGGDREDAPPPPPPAAAPAQAPAAVPATAG